MPRNTAPTPWAAPSQTARASRYRPPVGDAAALGTGLGAAAFFAGARLAAVFFAGALGAAAFFAGAAFLAGVRPVRFAVPAVPWEPLPDVREAMVLRLPGSAAVDTCAYAFTRPCRMPHGC